MIGAGAAGRVLARRRSRAEHAACVVARGRGAVTYARTAVVSFLLVCAVTVSGHVLLVVCAPAQVVQSPQQADPRINEIDRLIEAGVSPVAAAMSLSMSSHVRMSGRRRGALGPLTPKNGS